MGETIYFADKQTHDGFRAEIRVQALREVLEVVEELTTNGAIYAEYAEGYMPDTEEPPTPNARVSCKVCHTDSLRTKIKAMIEEAKNG